MDKTIYEGIYDGMPGGVMICHPEEEVKIPYVNQALLELYECDTKEQFDILTGGSFEGTVFHEDLKELWMPLLSKEEGREYKGVKRVTYRIVTRFGRIRYVETFGKFHFNGGSKEHVLFIVNADVKYLSYDIDHLTNLPGMQRFLEYAERMMEADRLSGNYENPYYYVYLDLNNFKRFNARYGIAEGDELLLEISKILKEEFPEDFISRFSDDHFTILTKNEKLEEKLKSVQDQIGGLYPEGAVGIRVGIYKVNKDEPDIDAGLACNLAKIAGDSIRGHVENFICYYSKELKENMERREYISDHIDEAIQKHYIKVYYQPVVRTISGNLCSLEALARWEDPVYGFLQPGQFISVLEESKQIYKLDLYIIQEICRNYARESSEENPIVPVSFNLSRLDFFLCNIFEEIEKIVKLYDVPRDMLPVEITESLFMKDNKKIIQAVWKFRKAGYQVWMDDFGSGYSSLNVLKDYEFDEIKIDMDFLTRFSDKSRQIIISAVDMSKKIGLQTLAEGVETREQFEFLRTIGCEKAQGYLFGKPMPYKECLQNCIDSGLQLETRQWRHYYDRVGKINFITDSSLAIVEDDGIDFHYLFANSTYQKILSLVHSSTLEEAEHNLNAREYPIGKIIRQLANRAVISGKEEGLVYPDQGLYLRMTIELISQVEDHHIYRFNLENITHNQEQETQENLDLYLRYLYLMYDAVWLLHVEEDYSEDLLNSAGYSRSNRIMHDLKTLNRQYTEENIYWEDIPRYLDFSKMTNIMQRVMESESGSVADFFRTKDLEGNYVWKLHTLFVVPKSNGKKLLYSIKDSALANSKVAGQFIKNYGGLLGEDKENIPDENILEDMSASELWKFFMNTTRIKFFWKDKDRRFVGASQNFLNYYGFSSVEDIRGKNDEEMGWHVEEGDYMADELRVLKRGDHITNAPGKCLIKGVLHNIVANKVPIYKDGRIIGLLGYFIDAEGEETGHADLKKVSVLDKVTDMMNTRGIIESMFVYAENYHVYGQDYAVISFYMPEYKRIQKTYGEEVGDKFLRKVAGIILGHVTTTATIGRLSEAEFVLLLRFKKIEEVRKITDQVIEELQDIHEVDGNSCTVFVKSQISFGSGFNSEKDIFALIAEQFANLHEG